MPCRQPGSRRRHHRTTYGGLRQGEGEEDADGVERDEAVGVAVEGDEDHHGHNGQGDDAIREGQPVAHAQEVPGREGVAGKEEQQARKVVERGVGGHQQDQGGGRLQVAVERAGAERGVTELAEHGFVVRRHETLEVGKHRRADEQCDEQAGHPAQGRARVAPLDRLERRDAVGDRLDAGHRGRAGTEGAQDEQERQPLGGGDARLLRDEVVAGGVAEPDRDEHEHPDDERVGRDREQLARLTDAAQVAVQEEGDDGDADHDRVVADRGDGGADGSHARGHRDGDGEDVVAHQAAGGREPGDVSEVVAGDDVRPAAVRIGADGLPVGDRDGDDQDDDGGGDWQGDVEALAPSEDEHREHRLGAVGDARERVG